VKKSIVAAAVVLSIALWTVPADAGLGVKVRGGYTHIGYGDFNDYVEAANVSLAGIAEMEKIDWLPEVSAEFTFSVLPTFTAGVGIGYLKGTSKFSFGLGGDELSYEHSVRAVPLTATAYWEPPLVGLHPYVFGGVGMYHTKLFFSQAVTVGGDMASYEADLTKWGFGLHGGAGMRFEIVPTVGLDVGVYGRWASISGFEGTATNQDGDSYDAYLVRDTVEDPVSGEVDYYGPWPTGDSYDEGTVDLSGFTIFIGVTVGF
jgi:opacity protein-like surface antigen